MTMMAQDPAQTTQRVKVGMIGLAAVLLLIGLAAAILSTVNRERQVAVVGGARPDVVATMVNGATPSTAPPVAREPLAELAVAPSASDGNAQRAAPAQTPR